MSTVHVYISKHIITYFTRHARIKRGQRPGPPPMKKHKYIGFLSNSGPDPLKNHKATKPAFNVAPSTARQRKMAFRWRADDGPLIVAFGSTLPHQVITIKKRYQSWTPSDKSFWIRACQDRHSRACAYTLSQQSFR